MLLISKKGKVTYRCKKQAEGAAKVQESHNRKKKYLLDLFNVKIRFSES